jgi:type I restriction enzyme S subunit
VINDLKPYPAMKDSGVPWLGERPEHWEVRRLKQICRLAYGDALATDVRQDGAVPVYGSNGRVGFHSSANTKAPCIVIGRKGSFGKVNFSAEPVFAIDTTFFVDNRFSSADVRWLFFLLGWLRLDHVSKDSAVPGLDREDAYQRVAAVPPLPEQAAIVRFLDHVDRRIRRCIRAKQRLIKLLEEQKQAIIHRAVTRGLDPNVRLKPSGVEWLGDVPEHWEVLALKRVLRRLIDCEHKTAPAVDTSEYRVVRTSAVRNGCLLPEGTYCTTASAYKEWTRRGVPQPGDVIFTREAPAGEACVVPAGQNLCLGQRTVLMKLRPNDYDPRFLVHMICAGPPRDRIQLASQGSTVGHFNMDDIGWMPVLKPPLAEQKEVAKWIADGTRAQDLAITRAEAEITLLREYRTRLIADVVTGKLDVREVAAKLPDEAEEPEPLDEVDALGDAEEDANDGLDVALEEAEE